MAIPKKVKERALELSREDMSANKVVLALMRQFPKHSSEIPSVKTIYRWRAEARNAEAGGSVKKPREESLGVSGPKQHHFTHLADVAEMLLRNDVGKVINVPSESTFTIVSDPAGILELTRVQLVTRIEQNIEYICGHVSPWDFWDCLMTHVEAEHPEWKDFWCSLNSNPLGLVTSSGLWQPERPSRALALCARTGSSAHWQPGSMT